MHGNFTNVDRRVVSFFIWDPELERKIDREVKMIDGISKMLKVASNNEQIIECNKALVLSQQRMLAFMAEIRRKQQNLMKKDDVNIEPTKGTVTLSDLHFPLTWTRMKKAKTEQKKFAVFCLARIGCEIIDTKMKFVDKQSTEILFTDLLTFENVPANFELHLEIYALNPSFSLSSSGKEFADRYSYFSIHGSPRMARKSEKKTTSQPKNNNEIQSKFILIGRTTLKKEAAYRLAKVRHLTLEKAQDNPLMKLPIEASFISRFTIQPFCYARSSTFGGILEKDGVSYSCQISAGFLHGEEIQPHSTSFVGRFSIPITPDTIILSKDNQLAFTLFNRESDHYQFVVEDIITLNSWIRAIQQHIIDLRAWQSSMDPAIRERRYSYHSFVDNDRESPITLKTRTRSLDDLNQNNTSNWDRIAHEFFVQRNAKLSITDDDDDESVIHTRL